MNGTGGVCKAVSGIVFILGLIGSYSISSDLSRSFGFASVFIPLIASVLIFTLILYSIGEALDRLRTISQQISALEPQVMKPSITQGTQRSDVVIQKANLETTQQTQTGQVAEIAGKIAKYATRPKETIVCPICKTSQSSSRSICWDCGCVFIFQDEKK